jgi:hypothetical protein
MCCQIKSRNINKDNETTWIKTNNYRDLIIIILEKTQKGTDFLVSPFTFSTMLLRTQRRQ